jgi:hypothetical protein
VERSGERKVQKQCGYFEENDVIAKEEKQESVACPDSKRK